MLMAHPAVLGPLVKEYETLVTLPSRRYGSEISQRLEDVSYTLCVATGTRDINAALVAARCHLADTPPCDDSALAVGHFDPGVTESP